MKQITRISSGEECAVNPNFVSTYPQAPSLLYKVIDRRGRKRSTALVTNIDFEGWSEYLGDPPIVMALLDRVVDGAIIHKFQGKSYRAHRALPAKQSTNASTAKRRPT